MNASVFFMELCGTNLIRKLFISVLFLNNLCVPVNSVPMLTFICYEEYPFILKILTVLVLILILDVPIKIGIKRVSYLFSHPVIVIVFRL